jgi:hypothetical protein
MISPIEKYDQELEQDIKSLEKYIDKDEKLAKSYFQDLGCAKEIAEEMAKEERAKGKHMYFDYPTCMGTDELLESLKVLHQSIKILPFRLYLNRPDRLP